MGADLEALRRRLAAGPPSEAAERELRAAGMFVTALDDLITLDLGDAEPFAPERRLVEDAAS